MKHLTAAQAAGKEPMAPIEREQASHTPTLSEQQQFATRFLSRIWPRIQRENPDAPIEEQIEYAQEEYLQSCPDNELHDTEPWECEVMASLPRVPSQDVAWDPSRFVGYSEYELEFIHKGFMFALNEAYAAERAAQRSAVNSHAQLINALENLAAAMENVLLHNKPMGTGDLAGRAAMVEEARAALSQAKGE